MCLWPKVYSPAVLQVVVAVLGCFVPPLLLMMMMIMITQRREVREQSVNQLPFYDYCALIADLRYFNLAPLGFGMPSSLLLRVVLGDPDVLIELNHKM